MRSDPLDTMASPSSQTNSADTEISSSESNFSLSVGYFPSQDINSYMETGPESESTHFLPPIQGAWLTENARRPKRRFSRVQTKADEISKLSITLAWDIDLGPDHSDSMSAWNLKKEKSWADTNTEQNTYQPMEELDCFVQKLETDKDNHRGDDSFVLKSLAKEDSPVTKDSPISTASPSDTIKTITKSIQDENMSHDSSTGQHPENGHLVQPVIPQECQLRATKKMEAWQERKETPSCKSKGRSSAESSSLSTGKRENQSSASPEIQSLSCLNIGRLLRWLREQVFSSLSGREQSQNKATKGTKHLVQRRQRSYRERRVQPQDIPKST
ncbi:uncharacterized protein C12orf71 homolog isoform X1 [Monodelphis domestica]|uniref:uncharacterized protein C12orf71 homolog isoform X1 n=1 Tax=Monodelphis domestica TaxID=13616 RepID=UPI0024E1D20A|nr:uncharacterized protein C12orf71 homolog isoform X1 [Monodelphis domestica]